MKDKIAIICGARPNFMKVAPLHKEFKKRNVNHFIINTGQHFSKELANDFVKEFDIEINYTLYPTKDSVISQFVDIMKGLEDVFVKEKPVLVVVVGDINSTLAGALVANKMNIKLVHIEAGLRSYNNFMPEEYNRVLSDRMANILLTTSEEGKNNLEKEGIVNNVYFVGNIMIDTLVQFLPKIKATKDEFYFCTLHRAENVDNKKVFTDILQALEVISKDKKIYLPLHPRTRKMATKFGLLKKMQDIFEILSPITYKESLYYQKNAKLVLTDSGGIQEESSYLGTPCITLRTETERPITVEAGTNFIGGVSTKSILEAYKKISFEKKDTNIIYWDGKTSQRIADILVKEIN